MTDRVICTGLIVFEGWFMSSILRYLNKTMIFDFVVITQTYLELC